MQTLGNNSAQSRLDDLIRTQVPDIDGIPPQSSNSIEEVHEWVRSKIFCQRGLTPTPGGLNWCNTLDGDLAFSPVDSDGGKEGALGQFPETFGDMILGV